MDLGKDELRDSRLRRDSIFGHRVVAVALIHDLNLMATGTSEDQCISVLGLS